MTTRQEEAEACRKAGGCAPGVYCYYHCTYYFICNDPGRPIAMTWDELAVENARLKEERIAILKSLEVSGVAVDGLTADLQAAGEREAGLREAIQTTCDHIGQIGTRTIIGRKLARYLLELQAELFTILATPPSVYAQRAQAVERVVKAARETIQTPFRYPTDTSFIARSNLRCALAAYDKEVQDAKANDTEVGE